MRGGGLEVGEGGGESGWVSCEQGDGEVAAGWVGEDACNAGALRRRGVSGGRESRMNVRTVLGPAPMMIARPDGGMVKLAGMRPCSPVTYGFFCLLDAFEGSLGDHLKIRNGGTVARPWKY